MTGKKTPINGAYKQSPIFFAYSTDGGNTFSHPVNISGSAHYAQGSRPIVGYDGTVYVVYEGSTRLASLNSTYIVKSTDGGASFSKPLAVATVADIIPPASTAFRVNSFPAGAAAPNGDIYLAWSGEVPNDDSTYGGTTACAYFWVGPSAVYNNCHSAAVYSKSSDGGATWSAPAPILSTINGSDRVAVGYPAPDGLAAPAARRVDTFWPGVAASPSGTVYMSAYSAGTVSPWQTCATPDAGAAGRINCLTLDGYIHNARLDYHVTNLGSGNVAKVTGNPINTRNGFGGGFIGDYTDLAVGSDDSYHAFWTDTNNKQDVVWFYGFEFEPTSINQEDVVTAAGSIP